MVPLMEPCLSTPPPTLRPVYSTDDATCPSQFTLCLDVDAGLDFEHNQKAMKRWMKEAWTTCGPSPDAGVDGGL